MLQHNKTDLNPGHDKKPRQYRKKSFKNAQRAEPWIVK